MNINQWLKNLFNRPSSCERCIEIMEAMLDGESTPEQELFLQKHVELCMPCFKNYDLELSIRKLIKERVSVKPVPDGLIESIKTKVRGIA